MQPAQKAPQRQPQPVTIAANSGVIKVPPIVTAEPTTVMARARRRMNQLLATTIDADHHQP